MPQRTEPASLAISAEPAWNRKGLPLLFGLLLTLLPAWLTSGHLATPIWATIMVLERGSGRHTELVRGGLPAS